MATFYFEQHCSRGRQGFCWKDLRTVPANWKKILINRLSASGTVPKDGRGIPTDFTGGVYISGQLDFGVIYRFIPGGCDFAGRSGGVITNCLFFKLTGLQGQSLKKAFGHESLLAGEQTDIPQEIDIDLDMDFTGPQAYSAILQKPSAGTIYTIPQQEIISEPENAPHKEGNSKDTDSNGKSRWDRMKEVLMSDIDISSIISKLKLILVTLLFGCVIGCIATWWVMQRRDDISHDGNIPIRIEGIELNHNKKITLDFRFEPAGGIGRNTFNLSISQAPVKNEE